MLPPGAGKTLVGLETARAQLAAGSAEKVVVLGPNTAIQGQWVAEAAAHGLDAGDDRDLTRAVTALTYQSVAVFDPDAEVGEEGEEQPLLTRLHPNGRALLERLRSAGPLLLVLDECHHLLEVWGRLLGELLGELPQARVLGLTATPPETLTAEQGELVAELFGDVAYETSIPAVVREGHLAPFAEVAWLTEPTVAEREWLAGEAERFTTLVTRLTDPSWGSVPFLAWVDRRFVEPVGSRLSWHEVVRRWPDEARAALRLHHAGLLRLPPGARLQEAHRHDPTAEDWMTLVDDWLTGHVAPSEEPGDAEVLAEVRRTLPAVGYQWTRQGIRRGRSPVDRVLARSAAKAEATVAIVDHEHAALGDRMRTLVLCDHERASATLPVGLEGVLDAEAGSAYAVIGRLLADPATAGLGPLLVTGRTVAGAAGTLERLRGAVRERDPALAAGLAVVPDEEDPGLVRLAGAWTSRTWVPHVTRFFEDGGSQVLVGTRALLGEGWNARRISGLVDLTSVTTSTAVVQTRGRALRTDPAWPEKVAVNWTVACVSAAHPRGEADWERVVRKHAGYYAVDVDGEVVDGVAHLDPLFSSYAAPEVASFDRHNREALARAADRDRVRALWQVGEPYEDAAARTLRVLPTRAFRVAEGVGTLPAPEPAMLVARPDRLEHRDLPAPPERRRWSGRARANAVVAWMLGIVAGLGVLLALGAPAFSMAGWVALAWLTSGWLWWQQRRSDERIWGDVLLQLAAEPPELGSFGVAVADALHATGQVSRGADAVEVVHDSEGEYRCRLRDVPERESEVFAEALDEAIGPVLLPRYVVPRHVVLDLPRTPERITAAREGTLPADGVVWHPVPTALGRRAADAEAYARALDHWVGCGRPLYTGSPEGAGVLASQQGSDPFAVSTVLRRQWR